MPAQRDDALAETGLATTRSSAPRLTTGTSLGRYQIKDVLGSGGMGVVYRAFDPELGRLVALKVVHPTERNIVDSQSSGRLVREAQAMARVASPNVIVVHDAGTVGDRVFVAMELVDGQNLLAWEQAEPRSWRAVVDVYMQAARGLAAAHEAGLVHRDFKPANALLGRDGRVRVLDFGLARTLEPSQALDVLAGTAAPAPHLPRSDVMTLTGAVMGTPQFMSPEQHLGVPADARSDQFSFCVALYHALYGSYPFTGKTYAELALAVTGDHSVVLPRSSVPAAIGKVVMRGLQREPAQRFASMLELVSALQSAIPRKRWPMVAFAAVAAIAVAAVIVALVLRHPRTAGAPIAMAFATNQQPVTHGGGLVALPAWSPDGTLLVYATETGLVLRNLTTGARVEIREPRIMWDIRWSPAGDRFMAASDHGVVLRARDGAVVKEIPFPVGNDCHAAWSPDAAEVLWHCDSEPGFLLVTIASATTRPLTFGLTDRVIDFDWSRAGIVLSTAAGKRGSLHLAHADGTVIRKLADDTEIGEVRWNALGTRVYYQRGAVQGYEIVYRDLGSSGEAVVVLVQPHGQFAFDPSFAVANDERSLVYLQQRTSDDLVQTTFPSTALKPLTADGSRKTTVALAPDQISVAFAADDSTSMHLYHLSLAGSAPTEIDEADADVTYDAIAFSPDSKELAVLSTRSDTCELWIVPVTRGPKRRLSVPTIRCSRVDWLSTGNIAVLRGDAHNLVVVDPVANTNHPLWPSDTTDNLEMYALSVDGTQLVANIPHDESSTLTTIDVATRATKVLAGTSGEIPFAWSPDRAWIYGAERPADERRTRIVASNLSGNGETRLVDVLGTSGPADAIGVVGMPAVFANGSGVVWIGTTDTVDLWLASSERLSPIPRGPPVAVKPAPVPPPMHAKPTNLELVGAVGSVPEGWKVSGTPAVPELTSTCGRPGACLTLDGASGGAIYQLIDATPYRGKRIRVRADLRVEATTCIVVVDSGLYATSEVPSGQLRVRDQGWEKRELLAEVESDAIYIELKVVTQHRGTCWVGGLELELVP